METKNYQFRENETQRAFYCQLQVSNKFRRSMSPQEAELIDWITSAFVHHTALTVVDQERVSAVIEERIEEMNSDHEGNGPFLAITYVPLRRTENGYIRIERTSGRHQSLLLPIIDYRGAVDLQK